MPKKLNRKEIELELVATLSEAVFGHGHAHYGYWPDGAPDVLSLQALSDAQHAYFELLADTIPDGSRTILDVGSGTGANALELARRGFRVECVSPSARLNDYARAKLPENVVVHTGTFERFATEKRFDLCLFAESFHYIELETALRKLADLTTGHVLIFDYFRRGQSNGGGRRGTHQAFRARLDEQGAFAVLRDDDLTEAITPTFLVYDHVRNTHVAPLARQMRQQARAAYPWRVRLAETFLARSLDKLEQPADRARTFDRRFEYRLILLERR